MYMHNIPHWIHLKSDNIDVRPVYSQVRICTQCTPSNSYCFYVELQLIKRTNLWVSCSFRLMSFYCIYRSETPTWYRIGSSEVVVQIHYCAVYLFVVFHEI